MKNKKIIALIGMIALATSLYTKAYAVKFYDTVGTRYEGSVERLGELGIINGVSNKAYDANRTITRAEFAKMIVEVTLTEEEMDALIVDDANCTFTDVSKDKWYYQYIVAATNYGYISGYDDNTFRPDNEVTYEQVAKMIMKALGHNYLVETDPRGWSAEYMDKLYAFNLADGTTKFSKTDNATRGNVAIMLWNTLTSHVWQKVLLNDVDGFTYVDSGRTLFDKRITGYVFQKNFKIEGFKEINGDLYIKIDKTYYKLYDKDATVLFSMIGGKAEGLFKYMRYPSSEYSYEIVGLSTDIGSQLYSGTLNQLKNEGYPFDVDTTKLVSNADYAYYLEAEDEENSRIITLDADAKYFYIDKIKVKVDKGDTEKDDKELVEKIKDSTNDYEYVEKYQPSTKNITLNGEYEIKDGAVLFENNKRVEWSTVKKGDIITEIKKDEYYFLARNVVECIVNDYSMQADGIKFATSAGEVIAYYNADCLEFYAKDGKTKYLYSLGNDKLKTLKGLKVRFISDFTGRAMRVEILEETEDEKINVGMSEMNLAYFSSFNYTDNDKNNSITLKLNGRDKTYRTSLKRVSVSYGDLVYFELEEATKTITTLKVATSGTKVDDKLKVSKITYDKFSELVENGAITENNPLFLATYHYDFGEYDKLIDFEVEKKDINALSDINGEKAEVYVVVDGNNSVRLITIKDFSEKKEVFYGKVQNVYTENSKIKIEISVFGYKNMTYTVSGLLNCEEGDMVSFKLLSKDTAKILEKFNVSAMGYYKDIVIKQVTGNKVTAENAEIDLKQGKITIEDNEYLLSNFEVILLTLTKDANGNLIINKGVNVEPKNIKLQKDDRIAINEIEDTVIIYRGYKA